MLSPTTNSQNFTAFLVTSLLCALPGSVLYAENNHDYRLEPIFPIPLNSDVDKSKAALGEKLFFDTRLSHNQQVSCASCHQLEAGGDDNVAMGISITDKKHHINTPSVFNARYNFRQNWDGSVKTLEQQIDMVITNHHEFGNNWHDVLQALSKDQALTLKFQNIYPDGLTRKNITHALVEFEKTLITPNSRFDQYLRNDNEILSEDETKGYSLFKELGCVSCHQGINVGGNLYQKFGVFYNYIAERGEIKKADYGRMNISNRLMDAFVFKVPSLRNVAVTAPYLHDGSAKTIEQAISIMGKTQLGRSLSNEDVRLLKAFLYTLTGEYKNKTLDGI